MMATATRRGPAELFFPTFVSEWADERDELTFDLFIANSIYLAAATMAISSAVAYNPPRGFPDINREIAQVPGGKRMPKYVIERDIPNIGNVTPDQVIAISQKSCSVLNKLGPQIQWVHSYVTKDKIYCVYIAPNEDMVREHARQGGFPANSVSEVKLTIDPTSAEG
jgi:Protein of unknown function (DUF4242)